MIPYERYYVGGIISGSEDTPLVPEVINRIDDTLVELTQTRTESGKATVSGAAGSVATQRINFLKPFEEQPAVTVSPLTSVPHMVQASVYSVDAEGFTACVYRSAGTDTAVMWQAVGR